MNYKLNNGKCIFDEKYFLELLAGSLSLDWQNKKRILKELPTLSQYQIDELIKIFEEELRVFQEIEETNKEQIEKMRHKTASDWDYLNRVMKAESLSANTNDQSQRIAELENRLREAQTS